MILHSVHFYLLFLLLKTISVCSYFRCKDGILIVNLYIRILFLYFLVVLEGSMIVELKRKPSLNFARL